MAIREIRRAWATEGLGGWYCDDKKAIVGGARADGYVYDGEPVTPGFRSVREPGEALLVTLEAEDGSIGEGDCVSVTYAGGAGRDRPFHTADYRTVVDEELLPRLVGRSWDGFRDAAADLDEVCGEAGGHPAIRYGLSQALLTLAACAGGCTVAEVICREYGLPLPDRPVPVGIQTGDDRYLGADKAILKRADVLPHGLIKTEGDFGEGGAQLMAYVRWLKERIGKRGEPGYRPVLHFDTYGTPGREFGNDIGRMVDYFRKLEDAALPFAVQIESPMEMESREAQIQGMAGLRKGLRSVGSAVRTIADEWCNTIEDIRAFAEAAACDMVQIKMPDLGNIAHSIEAVLYCRDVGMGAYLGGSCNETALSAQISAGVALATRPDQMLGKPGMGVDEALMIVRNEMARELGRVRCGAQNGR